MKQVGEEPTPFSPDAPPRAEAIAERLAAVDLEHPVLDKPAAERALHRYLTVLGRPIHPIRWMPDAEQALLAALAAWGIPRAPDDPRAAGNPFKRAAEIIEWLFDDSASQALRSRIEFRSYDAVSESEAELQGIHAAMWAWETVWLTALPAVASRLRATEIHYDTYNTYWGEIVEGASACAWNSGWMSVQAVYWAAALKVVEAHYRPAIEWRVHITVPMVDAYVAGLWLHWMGRDEVFAVPRPFLKTIEVFDVPRPFLKIIAVAGRYGSWVRAPHCADGPAVGWPDGTRYYFWRGVRVPEAIIMQPEALSAQDILRESNAEVRRCMIERIGLESAS